MNEREYNAAEGIRRSDLWKINDSPEKFKYAMDHPEENEQTPALLFGQAAHKILLEPADFLNEFAIVPDGIDRRTKAGKEEYAQFLEQSEGKAVIDMDTYMTIRKMTDKALSEPMVASLLTGRHEIPFFWTDPDTGVRCKVKVDCLTYLNEDEVPVIVDYKTTADARNHAFRNDAAKYGYYLQAYMYTEGVMRSLALKERPGFKFIVQEKKPPFAVNCINVGADEMLVGMDQFRELLGRYHECMEMDNWYGYMGPFGQETDMGVPSWLASESEE